MIKTVVIKANIVIDIPLNNMKKLCFQSLKLYEYPYMHAKKKVSYSRSFVSTK